MVSVSKTQKSNADRRDTNVLLIKRESKINEATARENK
jgi:hypothetical protein